MAYRKPFKFKLTKKQKEKALVFSVTALCACAIFWMFARPVGPLKSVAQRFTRHPKIVFVIDDIGNHDRYKEPLQALGDHVTYAILPLLPYSRYFSELGQKTGAEVILHLPLDTVQDKIPGRGLIVSTMSRADILDMLDRDLASVPHHVGVNNHMGSRGTADREMMTVILTELKRRKLFFLDSYTTKDSTVAEVGRAVGLPILTRGVFLDNLNTKAAVREEVRKLKALAREKGNAIGIGHYRKNTLEVLKDEIPKLEKEGFQVISLQDLLRFQRD
ncbi:MAG TPA: divergent polysaccharide deacetylase family protein [Candidatus Omnitrophota bacterium]|nr:divergent polysaccharide deacetylase family protein [Candidatus Omnitrophota bacterium]